jgi:phage terminase large subunit
MIDYNIDLWPKQAEAMVALDNGSPYEIVGYGGALGGGKSYMSRTWAVTRMLSFPNARALLIRESYPELERTHIDKLRTEMPPAMYTYVKQGHKFTFPNKSTLELGYASSPEDITTTYWGAEYDTIVVDECQNQLWDTIRLLRARLRTTNPAIRPKMLLTFNWGGVLHAKLVKMFWRKWMSRTAVENDRNDTWELPSHWEDGENPAKIVFIRAKVWDNPSITVNDPSYVDRIKMFPKAVQDAYLDGEPMGLEGQFFTEFGPHLREQPFNIEESDLHNNLFGALDSGTSHATAFGLYWIAGPKFESRFKRKWSVHRLFTYCNNGLTIADHAREIRARIEAFPWIKGVWPTTIVYDPSMVTKFKLNPSMTRSPIDEYKDVFTGTPVTLEPANNDRITGCQVMRMMMSGEASDAPAFRYWSGYNTSLEDSIISMVFDKNNRETYLKVDGDDCVDECRYGLVCAWTRMGLLKTASKLDPKFARHNLKITQTNWKDI